MTKKQKTMLARIIAAFLIYIPLFAASHKGAMEGLSAPVNFAVFLVPYLVIGWDIVYKAVRGIVNGQVFDENFLMTIATFGAYSPTPKASIPRQWRLCCFTRWESCFRAMQSAAPASRLPI